MEALQLATNTAITPATDLQPILFDRFISFIDRTEKTAQTYITNLRQFAAWMQYSRIRRPVRQDIILYRQYLTTAHEAIKLDRSNAAGWSYRTDSAGHKMIVTCKPSTVKLYLQSLRQFFSWTAAEGLYPNIAANIHSPKVTNETHKKEALAAKDVLTIERSITATAKLKAETAAASDKDRAGRIDRATEQGKRLYAMYMLAVTAGLRTIELERANVKDLEIRNGNAYLYIWGKGHTEADTVKAIAPEVYSAIKEYLASRSDKATANSPLFVSTGNRSGGQRIAARTISAMLKKAMVEAGYNSERITAHSLRHTAGTGVMELTGNLYTTQQYMRHASPATTEIYLHNDTDKLEAVTAQRLYNHYHGIDTDARERLEDIMAAMEPAQIEQLRIIAEAMKK